MGKYIMGNTLLVSNRRYSREHVADPLIALFFIFFAIASVGATKLPHMEHYSRCTLLPIDAVLIAVVKVPPLSTISNTNPNGAMHSYTN